MVGGSSSKTFKRIGIIGLGHVGLPLASLFATRFEVIGYDLDRELVASLARDNPGNPGPDGMESLAQGVGLFPSAQESDLSRTDVKIITVPTPLMSDYRPDLSLVREASKSAARNLKEGDLVILESTTYPGTTRDVVLPLLESSGLAAGRGFSLAYSPERYDPGNKDYPIERIPKPVGGIDETSLARAMSLYGEVFEHIVPVSSVEVAESSKMLENTFRNVNIALVNEFALLCERLQINVWEVVEAAATKPFGFLALNPGPGVGGHCIPLDPYYMAYRARQVGMNFRFVELAGETNRAMPYHVVHLTAIGLGRAGKQVHGSDIGILGLAYKPNISDVRESPSIKIIEELMFRGARISVFDPHSEGVETEQGFVPSCENWQEAVREKDCLVLVVPHTDFLGLEPGEVCSMMRSPPVVVDCCNLWDKVPDQTVYQGLGKPDHTS